MSESKVYPVKSHISNGALLDKEFLFKQRVWLLKSTPSISPAATSLRMPASDAAWPKPTGRHGG